MLFRVPDYKKILNKKIPSLQKIKNVLLKSSTFFSLFLFSAFWPFTLIASAVQEIAPCNPTQLKSLKEEILNKKNENLPYSRLLKNKNKDVVGFYAWSDDESEMYAEICEYIEDAQFTVASSWYYWEEGSTHPQDFKVGLDYRMTQDEGMAEFHIIKRDSKGTLTLKLDVIGWEDSEKRVLRSSILTLGDNFN